MHPSNGTGRALNPSGITMETMFRGTGLLASIGAGAQGLAGYYLAIPRCDIWLPGFAHYWASYAPFSHRTLLIGGAIAIAIFAAAFWETTRRGTRRPVPYLVFLIGLQVLISFLIEPHMLIMVAAEFPFIVSQRAALLCLLAVGMVVGVTGTYMSLLSPAPVSVAAAANFASIIAWQLFAFLVAHIATAERRGRTELAAAHAEVLAAQQLLAESSRTAERLRIARDLHDAIGHHLSALSLHLDLALRQPAVAGTGPLQTARDITRRLLEEVRAAVGAARSDQPIRLKEALTTLCAAIPAPQVRLSIDDGVEVTDTAIANTIFRCIQESLSNAIRHSGATTMRISLSPHDHGIGIVVTDDGQGAHTVQPGNGLHGMRERIEGCGGTLAAESHPGSGFVLRIWLPQPGSGR